MNEEILLKLLLTIYQDESDRVVISIDKSPFKQIPNIAKLRPDIISKKGKSYEWDEIKAFTPQRVKEITKIYTGISQIRLRQFFVENIERFPQDTIRNFLVLSQEDWIALSSLEQEFVIQEVPLKIIIATEKKYKIIKKR